MDDLLTVLFVLFNDFLCKFVAENKYELLVFNHRPDNSMTQFDGDESVSVV